jgi:hypothetical protein
MKGRSAHAQLQRNLSSCCNMCSFLAAVNYDSVDLDGNKVGFLTYRRCLDDSDDLRIKHALRNNGASLPQLLRRYHGLILPLMVLPILTHQLKDFH